MIGYIVVLGRLLALGRSLYRERRYVAQRIRREKYAEIRQNKRNDMAD